MRGARRTGYGNRAWEAWWHERGERELRIILMTAWDPIGVGDAPEAWGEYDRYLADLGHHLSEAADPEDAASRVASHLNEIESGQMEMATDGSWRANGLLARSIVGWHTWSFEHGGRPPTEWLE